ncbi:MAG: SusE domain-containing protein [Lentimicrobium sp.]|jgi:hypothetical protein|nr:SusE domain-containing protein [Lentimicrobium sp.]
MKKLILALIAAVLLVGCNEVYEFSTEFSVPTTLNSPASVVLDVASANNVKFTWSGGGAEQGIVIYEVLFDKVGGDFSNPVFRSFSDLGVDTTFTITQASLNSVARKAGIAPESTGSMLWTVVASKGGVIKESGISKQITVTRPGGIDYTGDTFYLYGTATENNGEGGLAFRKAEDGVFVIYTKVTTAGDIYFKSTTNDDAFVCYADNTNKVIEGTGSNNLAANAAGEVYRITVDLNTQKMNIDRIKDVKAIWGATFNVIGNMLYKGNGIFEATNCTIKFIMQSRPETNPPSWLGWVEERYYFIANVNGVDRCWGRKDGVSPERPTGNETPEFYELREFAWSQWDHLWKMKATLDLTNATITINTNKSGLMIHEFSNVQPLP